MEFASWEIEGDLELFLFGRDLVGDYGGVFSFGGDSWTCSEGVSKLASTCGVFPFYEEEGTPFSSNKVLISLSIY